MRHLFVEILVGTALDAYLVDFHARVPGFVEDAAGLDVAQFGAHESGAFAGFNVQEFNDEEILAVDIEAHAVLEISCSCHKVYLSYVLCLYCGRQRTLLGPMTSFQGYKGKYFPAISQPFIKPARWRARGSDVFSEFFMHRG